jgi:hypothetical protein
MMSDKERPILTIGDQVTAHGTRRSNLSISDRFVSDNPNEESLN